MATTVPSTSALVKARCSAAGITFCQGTGALPSDPDNCDIAVTNRFGGEVTSLVFPSRNAVSKHQSLPSLKRPSSHQVSPGTVSVHSNVPSSTTRCLSVPRSRLSMHRRGTASSYSTTSPSTLALLAGNFLRQAGDPGVELLCALPDSVSISVTELPLGLVLARADGVGQAGDDVEVVQRCARLEVDEVHLGHRRQRVPQRCHVEHRWDDADRKAALAASRRVSVVSDVHRPLHLDR